VVAPRLRPGHRPQRKNETVIQTCKQCGAINGAEARTCCLCDTRLSKNLDAVAVPTSVQLCANPDLAVEADWRSEVVRQIEAYHVRRGRPLPTRIELEAEPHASPADGKEVDQGFGETHSFEPAVPTIVKRRFRPARVERLEIQVEQSSFDFNSSGPNAGQSIRRSAYDKPMCSVAVLAERQRAGIFDVGVLIAAYGGFLMLFHALGGRFSMTRFDLLVTAAIFALLYGQYVTLFTYFAQATPGMMLRGLRISSLDGFNPSRRQLLWRSLGYLISAGTMMLGFVWTLWDEDQLSWHDRISQTCITADVAAVSEAWTQPSASR